MNLRISVLLAALACLLMSAAAQAITYSMSGEWVANRGGFIDIPINGGLGPCTSPPGNGTCPNISTAELTTTMATPTMVTIKPFVAVRPLNGGIPGAGTVPGTGAGGPGAAFTIPVGRFTQNFGLQHAAVPVNATVQQLDTGFDVIAPVASRINANRIGCNVAAGVTPNMTVCTKSAATPGPAPDGFTRKFGASAWMNQAGRVGKNFALTKPIGSVFGHVTYTGGAHGFGGTMADLLSTLPGVGIPGATWAVGVIPGLANAVARIPVSGMGTQHVGRGMSDLHVNVRTGAAGFCIGNPALGQGVAIGCPVPIGVNPDCNRTGGGVLILPATPMSCELFTTGVPNTGLQAQFPFPGSTTFNYGFPWTTGTVVISETGTGMGNPQTQIMSAMGSDVATHSTVAGDVVRVRTINLVAGGVSRRFPALDVTEAIDGVKMTMTVNLPEVGSTAMMAGALALIAGLAAIRRRF